MAKELTDQEIREMFRKMNAPESSLRQLADWHRRDGEGPVPEAVREIVEFMRDFGRNMKGVSK